jgi:hypothetical protein
MGLSDFIGGVGEMLLSLFGNTLNLLAPEFFLIFLAHLYIKCE